MAKIVRLTESDLTRLVRRVIREQPSPNKFLRRTSIISNIIEKEMKYVLRKNFDKFCSRGYKAAVNFLLNSVYAAMEEDYNPNDDTFSLDINNEEEKRQLEEMIMVVFKDEHNSKFKHYFKLNCDDDYEVPGLGLPAEFDYS